MAGGGEIAAIARQGKVEPQYRRTSIATFPAANRGLLVLRSAVARWADAQARGERRADVVEVRMVAVVLVEGERDVQMRRVDH